MKKKLCLILSLGLLLLLAACGAPEEQPADQSADNYAPAELVGRWYDLTSQRASMEIFPCYTLDSPKYEQNFDIKITWGNSYNSAAVWYMTAGYDPQSGELVYTDGTMAEVTYADDGSIAQEDKKWEDASGSFRFNEDGNLLWTDSREAQAADQVFERYTATAVPAETFVSDYFNVIKDVEQGTAGSSLKLAAAAAKVMQFAQQSDLWNTDIKVMRDNMLAGWESLSDEDRSAFDANFFPVMELIDGFFSDYNAVAGTFADAGVADDIKALIENPAAQLSWDTLRSNTVTMGNSDE